MDLSTLSTVLEAARPLGGSAGLVLVIVFVILNTRKQRTDQDRELTTSRGEQITGLITRVQDAEKRATEWENKAIRFKEAAFWWCEAAHSCRHANIGNITRASLYAEKHAITLPPWVMPDELPPFAEKDE